MAIMLALGAAFAYGSADFAGGMASRRTSPVSVAFGAQVAGLVLLLAALPLLGTGSPAVPDVAMGAVAGLFGAAGVVILFHALARGPMSLVAPTTALAASLVPIVAGVAMGERPGPMTAVGIAVSLVAVVLITREPGAVGGLGANRSVLAMALGGGAIFGLFFVFLHQAGSGSGLWPLLGARLVSVPLLALLVTRSGARLGRLELGTGRSVLLSGLLDMFANICYLLALRHGMLSVVAAITGLYPASTVMLAQSRLQERLHPSQLTGLGIAGCAAVLIAL